MITGISRNSGRCVSLVLFLAAGATGCVHSKQDTVPAFDLPRELVKVNQPPYRIEPPDILEINSIQTIPLPPYHIRALDAIFVRVAKALPDKPIAGVYPVDPEGSIDLGDPYGRIRVAGMTLPEAKAAIEKQLEQSLKENKADVTLAESRAAQQVRGRHLVRPDGTISLGEYQSVNVSGLTIPEAKARIEDHLRKYLKDPEVTVDVLAFNSKVYYVILDGGGFGQSLYRLPATGNETVLDALCQVSSLSAVSDPRRIWVSRPGPDGCESVLPVDWRGLTEFGQTRTNYQILPGDRVFVQAYPIVTLDTMMGRYISPIERLFGVTLLGTSTVREFRNNNGSGTNNSGF
jgi:polysaccharide export outer membrane protein